MPSSDDTSAASPARIFTRKQLPTLLVLMVAGSLTSVVGGMVAPVFPEVVEQFQVDPRWAGVLVSMHTLTLALFSPIFGFLADRVGKLKVLIPSLVGYALFGAAGAVTHGFGAMLLSRALVGATSGGIAAAGIGFLGSMYEGEARSRVMGYATSALATASVIFPLIGGWLGSFNWRYAFLLYGVAIPVAVAAPMILRENPARKPTVDLTQTKGLTNTLQKPSVLVLFLALGLTSAVFYVVIVYAPLYFKATIEASTLLNGMILASRAIGAAIVSAVGASRLAQRIGTIPAIAVGFGLMALTLVAIPVLVQPQLILLTALAFGVGFGVVMPNLYSALADFSPLEQRSGILAIGTGASSLGQFVSPVLLGPIWKNTGAGVFYVAAGVAIAVGLLSLIGSKTFRLPRPGEQ